MENKSRGRTPKALVIQMALTQSGKYFPSNPEAKSESSNPFDLTAIGNIIIINF